MKGHDLMAQKVPFDPLLLNLTAGQADSQEELGQMVLTLYSHCSSLHRGVYCTPGRLCGGFVYSKGSS